MWHWPEQVPCKAEDNILRHALYALGERGTRPWPSHTASASFLPIPAIACLYPHHPRPAEVPPQSRLHAGVVLRGRSSTLIDPLRRRCAPPARK